MFLVFATCLIIPGSCFRCCRHDFVAEGVEPRAVHISLSARRRVLSIVVAWNIMQLYLRYNMDA